MNVHPCCAALVSLLMLTPAASPAADSASDETVTAKTIATAIDTIVANHAESPAPQQLALTAARSYLRISGQPTDFDLARRAGELSNAEDVLAFLKSVETDAEGLEPEIWHKALVELAGSCKAGLVPFRDVAVNESLASNRYVGVGIVLGMQDSRPAMMEVFEGGPADRAGPRSGDIILKIDGADTLGWKIRTAIDALRGPRGSQVTVDVVAAGEKNAESRQYTITRDVVRLDSVEALEELSGDGKGLGFAKIIAVRSSTVHELGQIERAAIEAELGGLILDLRHAGRGRVHDTVLLASALLDEGYLIGMSRSPSEGARKYQAESGRLFEGLPLVILIDSSVQGSSEWLVAALKRHEAAILVGQRTSGNPMRVAQAFPIPESGWAINLPHVELDALDRAAFRPRSSALGTVMRKASGPRPRQVGVQADVAVEGRKVGGSPLGNFTGFADAENVVGISEADFIAAAIKALRKEIDG